MENKLKPARLSKDEITRILENIPPKIQAYRNRFRDFDLNHNL